VRGGAPRGGRAAPTGGDARRTALFCLAPASLLTPTPHPPPPPPHPTPGKKQDIKITGASTLNKDDVERMVSEADKFADEDKKRREAVEAKNGAESLVYQTEKQLKEFADKVGFWGAGVLGIGSWGRRWQQLRAGFRGCGPGRTA
jgi:hypothetical protein